MSLTPLQLRKLEKLAKVGDIAIADELNALEGKIEALEAIVPALREARDGEQGIQGERGEKGESIKGEQGIAGRDGVDGRDGKNGVDGKNGKDGRDGADGRNGTDGKDGEMGVIDEATIAYLEDEVKKAKLDKEAYDRALGIVDQRTSFLINKVNNLPSSSSVTIKDTFGITVDGGVVVLTTGTKGYRYIEQDCTITGWHLQADVSGDVVFDVKRSGVSIAGTEKPTLTAQQTNSDLALTTWTTSLVAGDIIEFVIDSASTITRATLTIVVTK